MLSAYLYLHQALNAGHRVPALRLTQKEYGELGSYSLINFRKFIRLLSMWVGVAPPEIIVWYSDFQTSNFIATKLAEYREKTIFIKTYKELEPRSIAAVLVHEFCHYCFEIKGLGSNNSNERLVDLAAFVMGFGEILMNGKHTENSSGSEGEILYLSIGECEQASALFKKINNPK